MIHSLTHKTQESYSIFYHYHFKALKAVCIYIIMSDGIHATINGVLVPFNVNCGNIIAVDKLTSKHIKFSCQLSNNLRIVVAMVLKHPNHS